MNAGDDLADQIGDQQAQWNHDQTRHQEHAGGGGGGSGAQAPGQPVLRAFGGNRGSHGDGDRRDERLDDQIADVESQQRGEPQRQQEYPFTTEPSPIGRAQKIAPSSNSRRVRLRFPSRTKGMVIHTICA